MNSQLKKTDIKKRCIEWGADIFGIADISSEAKSFLFLDKAKTKVARAICVGVRVSGGILDEIDNQPTKMYFHHYRTLNMFLDQLALRLANYLQNNGFLAIAIPASQIVDWEKQNAHLSHKKIGRLAGLGWIGRNNLLVNKKLGSQFRMVTVLTDLNVSADKPIKDGCGSCRLCIDVCPVSAIKERKEEFDHHKCFEQLKEFQRQKIVSQYICGICVRACKGGK
ncbi:4Fe-4S double cluster binding domain-containing protein [Candidatus Omnitrophota bacterium]